MVGIYKITNKINNKCYIGQSINIENRWKEHFQTNKDFTIYKAFKKYGIENFTFEVIELCSEEKLNEKEQYYINLYDSYNNGYNMTLGGSGCFKYDYQYIYEEYKKYLTLEETAKHCGCHWQTVRNAVESIQGSSQGKYSWGADRPIKAINPETKEVINTYPSISSACKELGHNCLSGISASLKDHSKTSMGYIWLDIDENENNLIIDKKFQNTYIGKKIIQLDKQNNIINTFNSVKEALEYLEKPQKNASNIYRVLKGDRQTAWGFKWKVEG